MSTETGRVRVLYSFPHKLGGARLSDTGWQEVTSLAAAGADVLVFPGALHTPVSAGISVLPTLARGKFRIPYRVLGKMRALALHDHIVARRLPALVGKVDVIHTFAIGSLRTLKTAARLGIPTVLERTNAHTRWAFDRVKLESDRLGVKLPPSDEYFYREDVAAKEEAEYEAAAYILCPSAFVVKTFVENGVPRRKLLQYFNGVDDKAFYPGSGLPDPACKFTMLFVGVSAVRKGVHFALEAWLKSPASRNGTFLIVGDFLPAYAEKLSGMLSHPSVKVLGHIEDVPGLVRKCDILVLPSIEEGFGRVITEAMASGCVPLASEACTEMCRHMETGMVHPIGDVETLSRQITMLYEDRALLSRLRTGGLNLVPQLTWSAVGVRLMELYQQVITEFRRERPTAAV